jgi:hypothetical protein
VAVRPSVWMVIKVDSGGIRRDEGPRLAVPSRSLLPPAPALALLTHLDQAGPMTSGRAETRSSSIVDLCCEFLGHGGPALGDRASHPRSTRPSTTLDTTPASSPESAAEVSIELGAVHIGVLEGHMRSFRCCGDRGCPFGRGGHRCRARVRTTGEDANSNKCGHASNAKTRCREIS